MWYIYFDCGKHRVYFNGFETVRDTKVVDWNINNIKLIPLKELDGVLKELVSNDGYQPQYSLYKCMIWNSFPVKVN